MFDKIGKHAGQSTRRHWLKVAGGLSVGTTLAGIALVEPRHSTAQPQQRSPENEPARKDAPLMQIGILLETFARKTLEERLDAVKASGLDCVQLGMDAAGLPSMPEDIPPGAIARISRAATARGIAIASLRGTFNMCHPDADQRSAGVRAIGVLAAACRQLGTSKIHICTGTRNRGSMWRPHPDNGSPEAWSDMVACVRAAVDLARPAGVTLAFEPEVNNVVDSAQKARRLLDEVGSPNLKVTMDAANLFHAGELPQMGAILDQAFALVGKDVVMAHAKDLDHDGDAGHVAAGHGKLDYDRYLSLLIRYGVKGPLFLHGLSEAQVPGCVAFLRETLARVATASS